MPISNRTMMVVPPLADPAADQIVSMIRNACKESEISAPTDAEIKKQFVTKPQEPSED